MLVPNLFPKITPGLARLAIIGEAPGQDEEEMGVPFVGVSGRFLKAILGANGVACDQLFFGNVCQHRPPGNEISRFDWQGPEIQDGLARLKEDLQTFRPNCVLLLGRYAFRAFRPDLCHNGPKGYSIPLGDWRGSVVRASAGSTGDFRAATEHTESYPVKCIATYHPAYILRAYTDAPLFKFDVARAVRHSRTVEWVQPTRSKILRPSLQEVLDYLAWFRVNPGSLCTWDIEGYADDVGITMLSLAKSPTDAIVIPFYIDGSNYWSLEDEVLVWQSLAEVLADHTIPKECHNGFYENFVSAWRHRLVVNNLLHDTMMAHWELFPEAGGDPEDSDIGKKKRQGIGRDLGTCVSIYTEIPYYKDQRLSSTMEGKLDYSAMDSLATAEVGIAERQQLQKTPRSYEHYRFNINLIPAYSYIMLRGCRLDTEKARSLESATQEEINTLQAEIDAGILPAAVVADVVTRKRKSDPYHFNVDSGNQLRWLLFEHLKYKPSARKVTETGKQKTDEDVLLGFWSKHRDPLLRLIIRLVRKRTRLSDIHQLIPDADGRIRSRFDPVGTNTGRLSSSKAIALRLIDGEWKSTGTNLQNKTKDLRECLVPDSPDFAFWQVDLSGADAWTVGADLASLGYPTMLEDMLYGIKPALVLYFMLQEHANGRSAASVNTLPRDILKQRLRDVKQHIASLDGRSDPQGRPLDWQYLCCKRVQHGSNYGARPEKIAEVIFGDSDGTIDLSPPQAALYQSLYKLRYQTDHRNTAIRRRLSETGVLVAACGIRRQFFGIRNRYDVDDAIVREAAAFEPQANTTFATNKALERLWYDPSNRQGTGALHVEPLLQIHDALAGQFRRRDTDWACGRLTEWFNNPIIICGTKLNIPAEGKWGTDWKNTSTQFL